MGFTKKQPNSKEIVGEVQSSKGYIRRQVLTAPDAADDDNYLVDQATSDSVITTVTTFLAQPDFPRNVTVTPGGTTADVPAGDITITGTNIRDEVITEAITLAANASTLKAGLKAFKTVTSVVFPVQDGAAATYDVGFADVMGLDRKMAEASVLDAYADGVRETTAATVTFSATAIESNTVDTNTANDASVDFAVIYITTEKTSSNKTTA